VGIGLVRDCIRLIEQNRPHPRPHQLHETDQAAELREALAAAEAGTFRLAARLDAGQAADELPALLLDVLRLRLAGGELSLRAAQAAMLHQGARGYLRTATAQRRLREAYFIAIVTPALKHLRREIARREGRLAA
jgi:alkylation response protein AidB-like acyl-CoA dehydrogenase